MNLKEMSDGELVDDIIDDSISMDFPQYKTELLIRLARGRKAIADNDEWDLSFKLFHNAIQRGTNMWREAHPESKIRHEIPSTDKLIMWLLEELEKGRKAIEALESFKNLLDAVRAELQNIADRIRSEV